MLSRIAALLPLSSHVGFGGSPERIFVFATPAKFSEGSLLPVIREIRGFTISKLAALPRAEFYALHR
jgi:hypothetical protein